MKIVIELYTRTENDEGEMIDMPYEDLKAIAEDIEAEGEVCGYAIKSVEIVD